MSGGSRKRVVLLGAGVVLLAAAIAAGWWIQQWRASRPVDLSTLTLEQWREDLHAMADGLARKHANAFHRISRERYAQLVARIDGALKGLPPSDIPVYFAKLTAAIGDAHTYVSLPADQHFYPFGVFAFGDALRVTRATPAFRQLLGARLVKIGDVEIGEVEARLREILTQGENEWFYRAHYPWFLTREVLHALGVVGDAAETTFTFVLLSGATVSVPMLPSSDEPEEWVRPYRKPPLSTQHADDDFWFTTLPGTGLVYVAFNSYRRLSENAAALFRYLDAHREDRLVIDMRNNFGGDYLVGHEDLIAPILERTWLNRPGCLYVITGRFTFSAAMNNAAQFRTETRAELVGEPPGEVPNGYQERRSFRLPHSHLLVSYSTRLYKFLPEDAPALLPDKSVEPEWADYEAGRDAALEWIVQSSGSSSSVPPTGG